MSKTIGKEFLEGTKYKNLLPSSQSLGLPQPPLEVTYTGKGELIDLPKPEQITITDISLRKAIEERKSLRAYSDKALTLEELSYLLWCTQGVKEVVSRPATLRTVPSAGARHSFETYLLINNVDGLRPGLYRFLAIEHKLVEIKNQFNTADRITMACLEQPFVKKSAVTFLWAAVKERMHWRYGERGYRYLFLDAGHVCQNLYLAAQSIDSGVCAIAAYDDDEINKLLKLDGEERFVIYIATLGKKK